MRWTQLPATRQHPVSPGKTLDSGQCTGRVCATVCTLVGMDIDVEVDYAEIGYLAAFCGACGTSPCEWDGKPDGFHTDDEA